MLLHCFFLHIYISSTYIEIGQNICRGSEIEDGGAKAVTIFPRKVQRGVEKIPGSLGRDTGDTPESESTCAGTDKKQGIYAAYI